MRNTTCALLIGFSLFVISGCATQKTDKPLPDLTFSRIEAEPVYVAEYTVEPALDYLAGKLPQGFVADPAKNVQDFFQHRFKAVGTQGRFNISIIHASVNHDIEKSENSLGAFLNVAKKDRYTTQVVIRLQTYGVGGYETQKVDLRAKQTVSISEHVSLAERERLQLESINDLIGQLDQEAQKILKNNLRITGALF